MRLANETAGRLISRGVNCEYVTPESLFCIIARKKTAEPVATAYMLIMDSPLGIRAKGTGVFNHEDKKILHNKTFVP